MAERPFKKASIAPAFHLLETELQSEKKDNLTKNYSQVLIIGAGPAGLLLAVLLAKHGIPIEIIEAENHLNEEPRAAVYGTPAIPDFIRAGLLDEIKARGIILNSMCWRDPDTHEIIAGFDSEAVLQDVDGMDLRAHTLVLQDLVQLMLDRVTGEYGGAIKWEHRVVAVGQDGDKAWVECETPEGRKRVEGDYVIGCDGANSAVRKSLFGDNFPGFTWDAQIIATNVSSPG
jgi:2-polyprenyl-6-methoxyphenol hydroxylase-like FAD-dependent oxidoreductase